MLFGRIVKIGAGFAASAPVSGGVFTHGDEPVCKFHMGKRGRSYIEGKPVIYISYADKLQAIGPFGAYGVAFGVFRRFFYEFVVRMGYPDEPAAWRIPPSEKSGFGVRYELKGFEPFNSACARLGYGRRISVLVCKPAYWYRPFASRNCMFA